MRLITFENVSMSYEGNKVLSNLSFDIEKGDYLCIVGENGSGKTTLLKGLLGLKKIDSGKIIYHMPNGKKQIGYLPQQTHIQKDFPASVKEVVMSGNISDNSFRFFYKRNHKKKALEVLEKLEILDLLKKGFHTLSGGQKQKVMLARAICASKDILILDEPASSLDITSQKDLYDTIKKLNDEGMTIVMISHDIKNVAKYSKHIIHIKDSSSLFYGTSNDYTKMINDELLWENT